MFDQRSNQVIDLSNAEVLKENVAYKYTDSSTNKELVVKFIDGYTDAEDAMLIAEFRKLALLSSEPEIATVYFLAKAKVAITEKSCYVMDFVLGYDLDEFINSHKYMSYDTIYNIIVQIASGLEKAHHYDIFHNDLHNKNIRINTLEHVKIIDFLWREYPSAKKSNTEKDLNDFKRIISELSVVCEVDMTDRMSIMNEYCQNIHSFTNLKRKISKLNDISFSLNLLGESSFIILSKLLHESKNVSVKEILHAYEGINEIIPDVYIANRTQEEEGYLNSNREYTKKQIQIENGELPANTFIGLRYSDSRIEKIKNLLDYQLLILMSPIENAGFIKFDHWVSNKEAFEGPYYLVCNIFFTLKFAELREIDKDTNIIKNTNKTWQELILNPVPGLKDSLPKL